MKLNKKFILHKNKNGVYVVPIASAGFNGLIRGNKSVTVILECLMNETTEEEIVQTMMTKYDGDEADIRADVADVISRLRKIGAIDESAAKR